MSANEFPDFKFGLELKPVIMQLDLIFLNRPAVRILIRRCVPVKLCADIDVTSRYLLDLLQLRNIDHLNFE